VKHFCLFALQAQSKCVSSEHSGVIPRIYNSLSQWTICTECRILVRWWSLFSQEIFRISCTWMIITLLKRGEKLLPYPMSCGSISRAYILSVWDVSLLSLLFAPRFYNCLHISDFKFRIFYEFINCHILLFFEQPQYQPVAVQYDFSVLKLWQALAVFWCSFLLSVTLIWNKI